MFGKARLFATKSGCAHRCAEKLRFSGWVEKNFAAPPPHLELLSRNTQNDISPFDLAVISYERFFFKCLPRAIVSHSNRDNHQDDQPIQL